jgi:hypothetical protein
VLARLGLSCQRPLWRAYQQDPERVRRWREQEYPAIRVDGEHAFVDRVENWIALV